MTYSSLMVHLDLGVPNETLLRLTADMAERFGAGVLGVTACQPMQMQTMYGNGYTSADVIEQDRAVIESQGAEAEDRFRTVMHNRVPKLQWRSTISCMQLTNWVADHARGADLLLMASRPDESRFESMRRLDIGDLVMRIGRPLVVVPPSIEALDLEHVVIGWKDTRETRRAVLDALPLLRSSGQVTVLAIVEEAEEMASTRLHLAEVVAWLEGHGVAAEAVAEPLSGGAAAQLEAAAAAKHAGLLVIGAYGHNRLREWVLGGIMRDALRHPARYSFMSH